MSVLKKLEDQLNCPICLSTYTNPKQLQCHHVYCQQCLVKLVVQDRQGQLTLTCPNCRHVQPVPASGVAGLQPAFRVNQLLEIVEEHKKVTATTENVESASTGPTPHKYTTVVCTKHGGKEVELYCETCEETICWKCIKKNEKHHSHNYEDLDEAFEQYKKEITSALEPLERQLTTIEKNLKVFDARHDEISDQRATIETDIHNTITRLQARLHETLEVRKTELINQLDQLTQAKFKRLSAVRDQIETTQAQLSSCLLFIRESLKTDNQGEALKMKSTTVRQVKELTITFQPDMLELKTEANIIFAELADLTTDCQNYGKVYEGGPPDPSKCSFMGKGVDIAAVGGKCTAILQILDLNNQPCKPLTTSVSCELVSEIVGTRARGIVERKGQSQYEISYQPTIKGRHQLHIKVEGQHIKGSPFQVCVRSPMEKLSVTPILTISGLKKPEGIAVSHSGELLVSDESRHCISVFSPSGKKLYSFGEGSNLKSLCGLAEDGEGNILVADRDNHCIRKYTAHGIFLKRVGTKGSGPLKFSRPYGIAVSASNGRVYVVDIGNHCVQILNSDLEYLGTFGDYGSDVGQFNLPHYIAFDSTGNVYVTDIRNHRIQVFTAEGKFLRMFGKSGSGRGELQGPSGIAIDSSDRVYVAENHNSRVSVFTSEGEFVSCFGSYGSGQGQFSNPRGLAVDSCGVVYVCDWYNNRVVAF